MRSESQLPVNKLLSSALKYARRGLHVLPLHTPGKDGKCSCSNLDCAKPGKHPRYHEQDLPNGLNSASRDPALIRKWWTRWPDANIGVRTGQVSGLIVVDVDPPNGEDTLDDLIRAHGDLPDTWQSLTGRGRQLWFGHPGNGKIPSRSDFVASGTNLDIKADGGYVVAPPSIHYLGKTYEWELSSLPDDTPLAGAPLWLVSLARDNKGKRKKTAKGKQKTDFSLVLNGVPDGTRDDNIFRYVCSRLARGMSIDEIKVLVVEAARNCDPPFDESDALKKVDWAASKYHLSGNEKFNLTDFGNAERLAKLFGERIRHCKALGWLVYDGKRWTADDKCQVQSFAKQTVRKMYLEGAQDPDEERRTKLISFALKQEAAPRIAAMIQLLPSEPGISVSHDVFDADPMLFNVENGTLDLRTGELRPHSPDDLITRLVAVEFDRKAKCPRWERFVSEIMNNDAELISFLQRLLGYALTGLAKEQIWVFLWGKGANGKTTLLSVLAFVLGDYAVNTPPETFLESSGERIRNDLARLRGARLITSSEPKGKRFDPGILKAFTGEDTVTARFLHKEHFEFMPTGKLFFSGNERPGVKDQSAGFWRRVILIPFVRVFGPGEKDPDLRENLKTEAPGILNWLIQGCLAWQRGGLNPPLAVHSAVEDYRTETDVLADFLESHCAIAPGQSARVADLYESYLKYCSEKSIRRGLSKHKFNEDLLGRPGITKAKAGPRDERSWTWFGISLKAQDPYQSGRSCTTCNLEGEPCPKGIEERDAATCEYHQAYH